MASQYKMSISLNVLNHLGIGLYSNIPAVLSEVVANAWDADATEVKINIDIPGNEIVIVDNGNGMTRDDINNKYLMVGYSKRVSEPGKTQLGRDPMGRKGIGKLSLFSIADIIEIYSVKNGERNALKMDRNAIELRIKGKIIEEYFPDPLGVDAIDFQKGTKIILRKLKKELDRTAGYLRKRLARRFSIIGEEHDFHVWINGEEITVQDRDYYDALEFLWYFGKESEDIVKKCTHLRESFEIDPVVFANKETNYSVKGWIGTIDEQRHIEEQNNNIIIYAHGKLVQEDILKDFKEGGIYAKYLMGEIDADFMDLDDKEDIVTSDRQRVKEDDPR
ncbi:MAG: ATP-binding protein, partial [Acidimicrobiales bacterium]